MAILQVWRGASMPARIPKGCRTPHHGPLATCFEEDGALFPVERGVELRCWVVRFVDLPWAAAPAAVTAFLSIFSFCFSFQHLFLLLSFMRGACCQGSTVVPRFMPLGTYTVSHLVDHAHSSSNPPRIWYSHELA